jgi:hypothetical protein
MKHPSEWTYGDPAFHEVLAEESQRNSELGVFRNQGDSDSDMRNLGHFGYTYLAIDVTCWINWPARTAEIRSGRWGTVDRGEVIAQLRKLESQEQLVAWCKMVTLMLKD